ncbi:hypothetical protein WS71_05845 [Burkholderia mayonis]|uniref:Uncharacterized protein n=1 Tax=Burkholderia mayonis TaxID=1385591 RepID=A0A1B4FT86_9BURK|nr:hypothetical protein WS71_05845 [Burkholderia mayonis]
MLPLFFCDLKLHLQTLVLRSQTRQFHLLRRNRLRSGTVELARRLGLHPVAKRLLRNARLPGHHGHSLAILDTLYGGQLELRRVHLFRYLEHASFPSFPASLYTTSRKAKFQGKLIT